MNSEIKNDSQLIAYCGLYCGACGKYLKGKCPSCKQIQGKHWCNIRTCNIDQQFSSCVDCSLETPNACRKFNNPISKIFALIFRFEPRKMHPDYPRKRRCLVRRTHGRNRSAVAEKQVKKIK